MAPEIPLDRQRPAEYVFSKHVDDAMAEIKARKPAQGSGGEARRIPRPPTRPD